MKTCRVCKTEKEEWEFPVYPNEKLNNQCLACRREKMKRTRELNALKR